MGKEKEALRDARTALRNECFWVFTILFCYLKDKFQLLRSRQGHSFLPLHGALHFFFFFFFFFFLVLFSLFNFGDEHIWE